MADSRPSPGGASPEGETPGARAVGKRAITFVFLTVLIDVIGFAGLAAGPEVILVDRFALADPFLARLPLAPHTHWRIAHLPRKIPPGYLFARRTGSLDEMEPQLREYYAKLSLLVSGPLLSWERLRAIAGFNLGCYDTLLDGWRARVVTDTTLYDTSARP